MFRFTTIVLILTATSLCSPLYNICYLVQNINMSQDSFISLKRDFDSCYAGNTANCRNSTHVTFLRRQEAVLIVNTCSLISSPSALTTPMPVYETTVAGGAGGDVKLAWGLGATAIVVIVVLVIVALCCCDCCKCPEINCCKCR